MTKKKKKNAKKHQRKTGVKPINTLFAIRLVFEI